MQNPSYDLSVVLKQDSLSLFGHSERFTALHGEEKREEGVRGDPNEIRWNHNPEIPAFPGEEN